MNLKELIELNRNKFKKSTIFEEIHNNEYIINFNNKLEINFENDEEINRLYIKIFKQDKRYLNKKSNNYDNEFNYNAFNGWIVKTNDYSDLNFSDKIIDLIGYDNELNSNLDSYLNQQEIIDLILALEDWSINCPFFKYPFLKEKLEEIKEEENSFNNFELFMAKYKEDKTQKEQHEKQKNTFYLSMD